MKVMGVMVTSTAKGNKPSIHIVGFGTHKKRWVNQFLNISSLPLPWCTWRLGGLMLYHFFWCDSLLVLQRTRFDG